MKSKTILKVLTKAGLLIGRAIVQFKYTFIILSLLVLYIVTLNPTPPVKPPVIEPQVISVPNKVAVPGDKKPSTVNKTHKAEPTKKVTKKVKKTFRFSDPASYPWPFTTTPNRR